MSDVQSENGHLAPEAFVDLLEGAPVEASHRLHLDRCDRCRRELHELQETLALAKMGDVLGTGTEVAPKRRRPFVVWLAAAAAVALVFVGAHELDVVGRLQRPGEAPAEALLPPVDQDDAFQLLLALSREAEAWPPEGAGAAVGPDFPLPEELSPDERERLLQALAEELEGGSS